MNKAMLPDKLIPTRASLLNRLKDMGDNASWNEFFLTYRELIFSVARKAGLKETEADEVVQDTLIEVARKMPEFTYQPGKDSFKGWLLQITRWRITDQFRKRPKARQASNPSADSATDVKIADDTMPALRLPAHGPRDGTAMIERVPDPAGFELEKLWDEEWEKHLLNAALARIKRQVRPEQYEIYHLNVILDMPAREVMRTLGVSAGQIYLAKHRVSKLLKKVVKELEAKMI